MVDGKEVLVWEIRGDYKGKDSSGTEEFSVKINLGGWLSEENQGELTSA